MLIKGVLLLLAISRARCSAELLVSSINVVASPKNFSVQTFNIILQSKSKEPDVVSVETREIRLSIMKEDSLILEKKTFVIDNSYTETINYHGNYMGILEWIKSDDEEDKSIHLNGYVTKNANGFFLVVEEWKNVNVTKLLAKRKIQFRQHLKIDIYVRSVDGKKHEIPVNTIGTIICKIYKSSPEGKPDIVKPTQLLEEKQVYDGKNKEIRINFRAQTKDHLLKFWCLAENANKSAVISVLHPPTKVVITPTVSFTIPVATQLNCLSFGGYPSPEATWTLLSGPQNARLYYEIVNTGRTFILKERAPVGSHWKLNCKSWNNFGQTNSTVEFAAAVNQTHMLMKRILAMEQNMAGINGSVQAYSKLVENQKIAFERNMAEFEQRMFKSVQSVKDTTDKLSSALEKRMTDLSADVRKSIDKMKGIVENVQSNVTKRITEADVKLQAIGNQVDKALAKQGKYIWKVDNIRRRREDASNGKNEYIYSDYFYSHLIGHRLRMGLFPNGFSGYNDYLSLYIDVCNGPFDAFLPPTAKLSYRTGIINQLNGGYYYSANCSHTYVKLPVGCNNHWQGYNSFILWTQLSSSPEAVVDESIVIQIEVTELS